jgi:hypothetical protein
MRDVERQLELLRHDFSCGAISEEEFRARLESLLLALNQELSRRSAPSLA